jgi:glutamate dehydrogenase (NADP+)
VIEETQPGAAESEAGADVESFMHGLIRRNPGEAEFHQAVQEFVESVMPYVLEHPEYQREQILERMTEPDRIVISGSRGRTTKATSV